MRLLLVRHGDSEYEAQARYWGHTDITLSPVGFKQAERLRDRLSVEELHYIYSSDLQRALSTAQIITSIHKVNIVPCAELREINFGKFEGKTFEEIKSAFPNAVQYWTGNNFNLPFPDGESLRDLENRVESFVGRLAKHPIESTVLIVAHGGPLKIMLCNFLRIGLRYWWQICLSQASLTILETYPQGAILCLLNDVCHLHHSRHTK